MNSWRDKVTYPAIPPTWVKQMLDLLCELLPQIEIEDRYSYMTELIEQGTDKGLINGNERFVLRNYVGQAI